MMPWSHQENMLSDAMRVIEDIQQAGECSPMPRKAVSCPAGMVYAMLPSALPSDQCGNTWCTEGAGENVGSDWLGLAVLGLAMLFLNRCSNDKG